MSQCGCGLFQYIMNMIYILTGLNVRELLCIMHTCLCLPQHIRTGNKDLGQLT